GRGGLVDDNPVLARFNRCRFELLDLDLKHASPNGRVSFQNCAFALLRKNPMDQETPNVDFTNCVFESLWKSGTPTESIRKDLNDLFWQPYR
ncbi:MAG: hypothetical protein KJ645_12200, partial [Planctomycetes bacterium]|nr:hypothetical protein [Planctomycetota bacterium]